MNSKYPLISVLVLCYNNQKYIYENLNSIFSQTYPSIEILIADDASNEFNADVLISWINENKTENIKKIAVFENEFNVGTVSSLENLQRKSNGMFLFNIAADDVLFDENVLMSLYLKAIESGEDAQIICAETELWDEKLENKIGDFLKPEGIRKIKESTPIELFIECSWHAFFPACYLYHRSLLDVVGELTGKYRLVEDWATQLIAFRKGIKPYCCDIRSSIKHRDGGISHGNSLGAYEASLYFYSDFHKIYKNEIEPYLGYFNEQEKKRTQTYAQDRFRAYYKVHLPKIDSMLNNKTVSNDIKDKAISTNKTSNNFFKDKLFYLSKLLFSQITSNTVFFTKSLSTISFISFVNPSKSVIEQTFFLFQ